MRAKNFDVQNPPWATICVATKGVRDFEYAYPTKRTLRMGAGLSMKITLNIPHSSIQGFSDGWSSYPELFKEVKRLTDWHTDILFKPIGLTDVKPIVFQHSRFKVDVERLVNDPLDEVGRGIIYTNVAGCTRRVDDKLGLMTLYDEHHRLISESVVDGSMLIDCHSFSSSTNSENDVCIGFNDDETRPDGAILDMIVAEFSRYVPKSRIALDFPFSNSTANANGARHQSMKIGIKKFVYMNEGTLELKADWYKINAVLNSIYRNILALQA